MRLSRKIYGAVMFGLVVVLSSARGSASPTGGGCETNSLSSNEVGVQAGSVGSCGSSHVYSSPDGSYGSTGCTNAWIVQVDNPASNNYTVASPGGTYYPSDQTTCQNTTIWIATYDGEGDGVITSTGPVTCEWVDDPPFAASCWCNIPIPPQNNVDIPVGTAARIVVQAKQNGSYIPVSVGIYTPPC